MACCALRKGKKQLMIAPLFLSMVVLLGGGLLLLLLSLVGVVSVSWRRRRDRAFKTIKQLLTGLSEKMLNDPFIFDSTVRCRVSGRLLSWSSPVAGLVYKYFNLILFGILLAASGLLIGGLAQAFS